MGTWGSAPQAPREAPGSALGCIAAWHCGHAARRPGGGVPARAGARSFAMFASACLWVHAGGRGPGRTGKARGAAGSAAADAGVGVAFGGRQAAGGGGRRGEPRSWAPE